jgi:hypothetical protein
METIDCIIYTLSAVLSIEIIALAFVFISIRDGNVSS